MDFLSNFLRGSTGKDLCIGLNWEYQFLRLDLLLDTKNANGKFYFLIIRSQKGDVFGAGFDCQIKKMEMKMEFRGSSESFVFRLEQKGKSGPVIHLNKATGENKSILRSTDQGILVGLSESGSALQIDSDLLNGSTQPCQTFRNEALNGAKTRAEGDFRVETIELFGI
jgi:TLD